MKIFITGATGFIGHTVARALRRRGHEVWGLARSEEKAKRLWAEEIRPVVGDLRKHDSYLASVSEADVTIHAAAEMSKDMSEIDRQAVERIVNAQKETNRQRTFIYTSGCWVYGNTGVERAHEGSQLRPIPLIAWRPAVEELALRAGSDRLSAVVMRPGCVYGRSGSITATWFESAEKEGAARFVGDGNNRFAMVHVEDLADAYARAVDKRVKGEIFNVVDRSRYTVREMASAASRAAGKGGEARAWAVAEAQKVMPPPFVEALTLDQHLDAWKAVNVLGWNPRFGGFVDDAELYFRSWKHRV
jgi:nucleoside-diphosphate-sugar epimerase